MTSCRLDALRHTDTHLAAGPDNNYPSLAASLQSYFRGTRTRHRCKKMPFKLLAIICGVLFVTAMASTAVEHSSNIVGIHTSLQWLKQRFQTKQQIKSQQTVKFNNSSNNKTCKAPPPVLLRSNSYHLSCDDCMEDNRRLSVLISSVLCTTIVDIYRRKHTHMSSSYMCTSYLELLVI